MVTSIVIVFIWLLVLLHMFLYKSWMALAVTFLVPVLLGWFVWNHPDKVYPVQSGINGVANVEDNSNADYASDGCKLIAYAEEDDTYDGFHMQREEEYKEEYGDDHEDAIQDEWEERNG